MALLAFIKHARTLKSVQNTFWLLELAKHLVSTAIACRSVFLMRKPDIYISDYFIKTPLTFEGKSSNLTSARFVFSFREGILSWTLTYSIRIGSFI